jgi:uroporphyrinogen-III synthase
VKLLIVRPQPGADATAARVEAAGHIPVCLPLFATQAVEWNLPEVGDFDAILLTSANALRHVDDRLGQLTRLPLHAVGQNSADYARRAGFDVKHVGSAGIESLLEQVDARRLLWLAGEDRTSFLPPPGMHIDCRIVYRSATLPVPDDFTGKLLDADYVLLHSARAASRFCSLVEEVEIPKDRISIAALSQKIASAAGTGWANVRIAPAPTDNDLLSQL